MKKENKSVTSINNIEDYFTETSSGLDIEANNIECNCITSRNNNFSVDSSGNINCNSININDSQNNVLSFDAIFNRIYPVGAIYISVNNINPSSLFGGIWQRIEDRFLLAGGSNYAIGNIGGEATHTLSIAEMPSHAHRTAINFGGDQTLDNYSGYGYNNTSRYYNVTSYEGGSQPHNNMPPYLVVNIWKRVS